MKQNKMDSFIPFSLLKGPLQFFSAAASWSKSASLTMSGIYPLQNRCRDIMTIAILEGTVDTVIVNLDIIVLCLSIFFQTVQHKFNKSVRHPAAFGQVHLIQDVS